jgi:hypothetical protein
MAEAHQQRDAPAKIGAGALGAMGRLGLNELRAAFVMPGSNIAQPTELGTLGTATPGEVMEARQSEPQAPSLADRIREMYGPREEAPAKEEKTKSPQPVREAREPERE